MITSGKYFPMLTPIGSALDTHNYEPDMSVLLYAGAIFLKIEKYLSQYIKILHKCGQRLLQ
mgnify:CR=1 FL=1